MKDHKHDVVIIGGGLAGAACARELVRQGIDAIAFERDRFPRNKVCGEFLSSGGVQCLEHLGLLDQVRAAGAVPIEGTRIHVGEIRIDLPFERPGLGISRRSLDHIVARSAPVAEGCTVTGIRRVDGGFAVAVLNQGSGNAFELECPVLIDAAGKLGRFTRRKAVEQFGVQYHVDESRGAVLDFWFFDGGYGGGVSVEGHRTNFCFLVDKSRLPSFLERKDRLVTGPIGYETISRPYLVIGDAAGMMDPFCGEGIHHALDSGITAARVVSKGIRNGLKYDEIRRAYFYEWQRRWSRKRLLASWLRVLAGRPRIPRAAIRGFCEICGPYFFRA